MGQLSDTSAINIAIRESKIMINPEWSFDFTANVAADRGVRLRVIHAKTGFEQTEHVSQFDVSVTQFSQHCATAIAKITKRLRGEIADDRWVKANA